MLVKFPPEVINLAHKFEQANHELYLVGGAVRDFLMGKLIYDWDFTTDAVPEEILKILGEESYYNNAFGTVGYPAPDEERPFEITTYRTEAGYTDLRHPDKIMWGKSLTEDLTRRDFTINAMAIKLTSHEEVGTKEMIIDPFDGKNDLTRKLVRAVGDPTERFSEDALRLMRAIRIAAELGFTIEEDTFSAIKTQSANIQKIARERIREELFKIMASRFPFEGITMMHETGLLDEILPELSKTFGVEQKSPERHHIYDVGTHCLMALKQCPSTDPLVRFATLIHDIGKPQTFAIKEGITTFYNHEVIGARIAKNIAARLKFSKKEADRLFKLVRWHQFTVSEKQTDKAIRRFITKVGRENVEDMLALRTGDRLGGGASETSWRLEEFKKRLIEVQKQPFTVRDLRINGADVMNVLGIKSGPKVGEVLNEIFKKVEENKLANDRETLLSALQHDSESL